MRKKHYIIRRQRKYHDVENQQRLSENWNKKTWTEIEVYFGRTEQNWKHKLTTTCTYGTSSDFERPKKNTENTEN
jgi:hypothetical protein